MTTRISNKDAKKLGLLPKGHKYQAKPTVVDGVRFASKKEARRYGELKAMEKAGQIQWLRIQRSFEIIVNGINVGKYIADFVYRTIPDRGWVYEDVKGYRTPVYRLKKKLVEALYGIKIVEV